jgi:hypothetical protein
MREIGRGHKADKVNQDKNNNSFHYADLLLADVSV